MWIRPGARVTVNLADGTTLTGTVRFQLCFWRGLRLSEVAVSTGQGDVEAGGEFRIPRHSLVMVQVIR